MEALGKKFIKKNGVREFNTHQITNELSNQRPFYSLNVTRIEHVNDGTSKGFIMHLEGFMYNGMIAVILNGADLFDFHKLDKDFNIIGTESDVYVFDFLSRMLNFIK